HPKRVAERFASEVSENIELLKDLPTDFKQIATILKKGKLQFEMNVKELHAFQQRLDKISNRLSFSIILLSFSILMASLIIGAAISGHTTLIWRLPVIEIGSVIATLMFLFMIFMILIVILIIGAAISGLTTLIWRLPVIEIGSVIATLMFLFMIFTIIRSGRM